MDHFTQHEIDTANRVDLAEFLSSRGISLKKVSGQYLWEDQNVWIRDNKWYSHYEQTGGYCIDFVMKYLGLRFVDAVRLLNGENPLESYSSSKIGNTSEFHMPERNADCYRIFMYLRNCRCIAPDIIDAFIKMGLLYEDGEDHCCVFVGRKDSDRAGHCHKRSILTSYKQTVKSSQAEYAFHYIGTDDTIYVFEAPIDMLAYISMHPDGWRQHSYVALCSVSEKALRHQLAVHPNLNRIVLCLDSDAAGQKAVERIKESLEQKGYSNVLVEIPLHKDWDEDLQVRCGVRLKTEQESVSEGKPKWETSEHSSLSL